MELEPITRTEQFLSRAAGGDGVELQPITRTEHFLSRIAGGEGAELQPVTRTEHFLQKIIDSGGGGPTPSGTISITENGTYNVAQYAEAEVEVEERSSILFAVCGDITTASASQTLSIPTGIKNVTRIAGMFVKMTIPSTEAPLPSVYNKTYCFAGRVYVNSAFAYSMTNVKLSTNLVYKEDTYYNFWSNQPFSYDGSTGIVVLGNARSDVIVPAGVPYSWAVIFEV